MNRSAKRLRSRRGFTLIEIAIATSILMIGMVSLLSASSQMHALRRSNRDRTLAQNAVRSMAERMHATAHGLLEEPDAWARELLAVYSEGGTFGTRFGIEGLTLVPGEASVGTIQVGTDETLGDAEFGAQLGLPRDLNGDGDAADADVSGLARLLPVLLTLRWQGENGIQVLRHGFYLMGY